MPAPLLINFGGWVGVCLIILGALVLVLMGFELARDFLLFAARKAGGYCSCCGHPLEDPTHANRFFKGTGQSLWEKGRPNFPSRMRPTFDDRLSDDLD